MQQYRAAILFSLQYHGEHKSVKIDAGDDVAYDDLLQYVYQLFNINQHEEIFIYAFPKDYAPHVRLCPRLLDGLFEAAQGSAGDFKVNLRVYSGGDFLIKDGSDTTNIPIVRIPKTSGNLKHGQRGPRNNNHPRSKNSTQPVSLQGSTQTNIVSSQVTPVQVIQPAPPKKSAYASDIDLFNSKFQVNSTSHNVFIDTNYANATPFEYKGDNKYSISLILKSTGTENVGKEFSLCKIAGNGSPGSFSLPLLKPQVTRTISITIEMMGDEEYSYWAVKKSNGEWIGNILAITVLKMQTKLLVKTVEYSQAAKDLDRFYWEK